MSDDLQSNTSATHLVPESDDAPLRDLSDMQLSFVGGGIAELVGV